MGDTFEKLATSISATDSSYALWLTSQVFVIVSRVKQSKNITFVGNKNATLKAIESFFEKRDLREERLFNLIDKKQLKVQFQCSANQHFETILRNF